MTSDAISTGPGPLARPTLLPGLRRIWRDRHHLQLGVDPARAVVLELPDAGAARLLDLLDGTRSERAVVAEATQLGIAARDTWSLLAALRAAGLVIGAQSLLPHNLPDPVRRRLADEAAALALRATTPPGTAATPPGTAATPPGTAAVRLAAPGTPAQILRRRAAARVAVTGHGPLATPVALALAQSGVGHVWPATDGAGQATAAIRRAAPGARTGPLRRGETSFVVQAGATGPANLTAAGYARRRLPHLPVVVRDGVPVIGPLVPPSGAPCLHCVDLHRRDRDPGWPELAAQLAQPAREPCGAATVLSAAGLAAGEVLAWLDGEQPATLGASIEVTAGGRLRRRSWPPHPRCGCVRRRPRGAGRPVPARRYGTIAS